ncbi:MAG: diacylglycerol kinase, partial [Polaromonas sp.]|nr:diacylglycerol kinase [Polaromonas sp.]
MSEQVPFSASEQSSADRHRSTDTPVEQGINPQKHRNGLSRVWHATGYSLAGLRAGWHEAAFRQEALASVVLVPAAFWLGSNWVEIILLAGTVMLIMIVELLNTAIET